MDKDRRADLSWKKKDFEAAGQEVPAKLTNDEVHTEGELMSEDELAEWLKDTQATFSIIKQGDPKRFEDLFQAFLLDIHYLRKIGKITEEEASEITKKERFDF